MHLSFPNVNSAFYGLVKGLQRGTFPSYRTTSRYGDVIQIAEPMTITYQDPTHRVLFNQARDCNPVFHVYESLWMLAGRNDVEPLAYYNSRMRDFSDDGETFNGAYGFRWRYGMRIDQFGYPHQDIKDVDQLKIGIEHLKAKPDSRRYVLAMWNVEDDLLKIDTSKDVCCNLDICFLIRTEKGSQSHNGLTVTDNGLRSYLDITVFNRSNDMVWGMLGANVVHMSFLQEYIAAQIGVKVGAYHQISNNLHIYTKNWEPTKWLTEEDHRDQFSPPRFNYSDAGVKLVPFVSNPKVFDVECEYFVKLNTDGDRVNNDTHWTEPFLETVAQPMCHAFHMHKQRDYFAAMTWVEKIAADDWQLACANWIMKRKANYEKKLEVVGD